MEAKTEPRRVFLVENDGGTIRAVQWALEDDPRLEFTGYVTAKEQIPRYLDEFVPDVALVDLLLPPPGEGILPHEVDEGFEEGLAVIAAIKEKSNHTRVIGFSNYFVDRPELVKAAIERGADALIAKQSGPADWQAWSDWLRFQIHGAVDGWWKMGADVARLIETEERSRQIDRPNDPLPLTERQMEVLHLLAEGCTDREISERLVIMEGAVRGHISNIKARLHLRYRWEIIEEARRRGIGKPSA